ncbi:hypothetical protein RintRC_6133 [Richelia intracellularis]|nr:hypothetical protein RintRC_6133 [Richelia intracellularis]
MEFSALQFWNFPNIAPNSQLIPINKTGQLYLLDLFLVQ